MQQINNINYLIKWSTPKELAYDLSVSYKTIIKLIKKGDIKAYRIGRHYKIHPDDIQKFIQDSFIKHQ